MSNLGHLLAGTASTWELQDNGVEGQKEVNELLVRLGQGVGCRLWPPTMSTTCGPRMPGPTMSSFASRWERPSAILGNRDEISTNQFFVKSAAEMAQVFPTIRRL